MADIKKSLRNSTVAVKKEIAPTKYQERKILCSVMEPPDKNWLWLKISDNGLTLNHFINGKWTPITTEAQTHGSESANQNPFTDNAGQVKPGTNTGQTVTPGNSGSNSGGNSGNQQVDLSNYYTKEEINKLLSEYTPSITVDSALSSTSKNPVQNKVVNAQFNAVSNSITNVANNVQILTGRVNGLDDWYNTNKDILVDQTDLQELSDSISSALDDVASLDENGKIPVSLLPSEYHPTVVNDNINMGTLVDAQSAADENPSDFFQWILEFTVQVEGNTVPVRKVIWHIPDQTNATNGFFIDALGSVIS